MTEAEKYLNRIENPMLKTDIYTRKEVIDFAEIFAKKQVEQAINFSGSSLELKECDCNKGKNGEGMDLVKSFNKEFKTL